MTNMRSLHTIGELQPGDHLCCLYETEEEHRAVLTPFMRRGLERGEKVLYIVDARTASTILDYLRDDGLDVEQYLARGQLVILSGDDAYTRGGVFDPDGMIALLRAEAEQALAEGFSALRVTGEMTWALRGLPGSERLMEYENRLNEFFPGSQCLAICQYDRRRFDPPILLDVLAAHPIAVIGTEVYDNFYYVPPAEQLKGGPATATLRNWVKHLAERRQAEAALRERTHELDERVKELNCLYGISKLVETPGITLEEIFQGAVELIPPAWQYPEVTCARITLEGQEFRSEDFRESNWKQTSEIVVLGQPIGAVEVCYLDERPGLDEGPFLKEERSLINGIAQQLGRFAERAQVEAAVRAHDAFLQAILDAVTHPFYVVDVDNHAIKMANTAARAGATRGTSTCYALTHGRSEPCRGDEHICPLAMIKESKAPVTVEHTHHDADGYARAVEVHCHPIFDDDGNVRQMIEYTLDITERRRAEEATRSLNKQLEEASRHKSEFLATLSHELRTPLNAVLGASELLAEGLFGELNEKQLEYVRDIHESGTHLLSLINDVLDLSKVEAGKLDLHLGHFDVRSLMESSAVIVRERAAAKSLEFNVIPPPEEVVVEADERKVKQIVFNLLSNAVKFTPEKGRVVFRAHRDGDEVIFVVEDTGPGIPDEFQERIFEEFFQTASDQEGTGLGLSLVKRLVELHGGRIWLESDVGQGSRFFFAITIAGGAATGSDSLDAAQ